MKNLKGILLFSAAALATVGNTHATGDNASFLNVRSMVTDKDTDFVREAADGGMFEVQLGRYAAAHGTTESVRQLGNMMVTDHTKANNELKSIAASKSISLPTTLGSKTQKMYDEITKKQGAEFDKAYASAMVSDHKEDLAAFKKEAESGADADIKNFAAGKVPVLEHHLQMSEMTKKGLAK